MKNPTAPTVPNPFRDFFRRILGMRKTHGRVPGSAGSYVGLFQGVIETDGHDAGPAPEPSESTHLAHPQPSARTSGFVRLEVSDKKRATGCFMFFVDGKVLSGAIEGTSEQPGYVEASFRLDAAGDRSRHELRPVAAVGRLHLETRRAHGPATRGEEMTIRFV